MNQVEENNGLNLTARGILEKDFKTNVRGYNKDEVDQYLDLVIKDYETFQKKIEELQQENARLRREIKRISSQSERKTAPPSGHTNYDILKRLSNLEKHVFGSRLYDDENE